MLVENWLAFCSIALLATAIPGPAALLVSVHSLSFGFKKSLSTIVGNLTGLFIMSALSITGLSTLIIHSATAFTLVKLFGAFYLIYMGIKLWRNGVPAFQTGAAVTVEINNFKLYLQGIFVAMTNPKAIVFTTALFPQFIIVSEPLQAQFLILVISFMTLSALCLTCYSLLALRTRTTSQTILAHQHTGKLFGSLFIGAGASLATISR